MKKLLLCLIAVVASVVFAGIAAAHAPILAQYSSSKPIPESTIRLLLQQNAPSVVWTKLTGFPHTEKGELYLEEWESSLPGSVDDTISSTASLTLDNGWYNFVIVE